MTGTSKRRLAKGTRLSVQRSLALAGAALLAVIIMGLPAIAQESPLSAWRLDEWGRWESLTQVNPYATITGLGSSEGFSNSGASVGITARAVFEPDLSRAELSAEFVPVSRGIITSDPRLFIAPLRQRLEWKVIVTVRNPNDVAMTNARVHNQFGKAFRAALTGQSVGDARMADADVKGLLPSSSGFTWDIGYLGPGDVAKAELTVSTNQAGGRAEFAEEGVYSLDTGFQLTYRVLAKNQVRNTAPCSVIARVNPSALRPDGEPYVVQQKPIERDLPLPERPIPVVTGPQDPGRGNPGNWRPAVITRVPGGGSQNTSKAVTRPGSLFGLTATGVSGNITDDGDVFSVPDGQGAEWRVEIEVTNPLDQSLPPGQRRPWNNWTATLVFGPNLTVQEISRSVTIPGYSGIPQGALTITPDTSIPGITRVEIEWHWQHHGQPKFEQGSHAYLALKVETGGLPSIPDGTVFCDQAQLSYNPEGGSPTSLGLDPIYIRSAGGPFAHVSTTATRVDWRVRKPGIYATLATEITATGRGKLQVQFSNFRDLARTDGVSGTVPAFYAFGQDIPDKASLQWIAASAMNNQSNWPIPIELDSTAESALRLWSMINVGEDVSSAEYSSDRGDDKGVITFIVSNN